MTTYAETALIKSMDWLSQSQQAIAHNLANVSSSGFKRRQAIAEVEPTRFHSLLEQAMPTVRYREVTDWRTGNLLPTNEQHHVALESQDFFRVRSNDGRTYLTRNGEMQVDGQGYLVDEAGYRYLDNAGSDLQVRADGDENPKVTIGSNGELADGSTGASLSRTLGVFRVADRDALLPVGNGRFVDPRAQDTVAVPTNSIRQGNVEASNVETVSELVNMLVVQRTFQATATVLRSIGQLQGTFVNAIAR